MSLECRNQPTNKVKGEKNNKWSNNNSSNSNTGHLPLTKSLNRRKWPKAKCSIM